MGRSQTRREAVQSCVLSSEFEYIAWDDELRFAEYDLVVNTTPAGAADLAAEHLPTRLDGILFDVIYKPWPTALAQRWGDKGGEVISGIDLLLHQGINQLKLVLDIEFNKEDLAKSIRPFLTSHH